jgi:hypothetical protein
MFTIVVAKRKKPENYLAFLLYCFLLLFDKDSVKKNYRTQK